MHVVSHMYNLVDSLICHKAQKSSTELQAEILAIILYYVMRLFVT